MSNLLQLVVFVIKLLFWNLRADIEFFFKFATFQEFITFCVYCSEFLGKYIRKRTSRV